MQVQQQMLQQQQLFMQLMQQQNGQAIARGGASVRMDEQIDNSARMRGASELRRLALELEEVIELYDRTDTLFARFRESSSQQLQLCWISALKQMPWLSSLALAGLGLASAGGSIGPSMPMSPEVQDASGASVAPPVKVTTSGVVESASTAPPPTSTTASGAAAGVLGRRCAVAGGAGSGGRPNLSGTQASDGLRGAASPCSVNLGDEACHADMLPTCPVLSRERAPSAQQRSSQRRAGRDDEAEALESETAGSTSSVDPNTTNSLSSEPRESSDSLSSEPHHSQHEHSTQQPKSGEHSGAHRRVASLVGMREQSACGAQSAHQHKQHPPQQPQLLPPALAQSQPPPPQLPQWPLQQPQPHELPQQQFEQQLQPHELPKQQQLEQPPRPPQQQQQQPSESLYERQ